MVESARDRILIEARRLFSQNTYANVSLKDVATTAGVSVALVVKHFGSKPGLFAATVDFQDSSLRLFAGPFERLGETSIIETLSAPVHAPYSIARTISVASGEDESLTAIGSRVRSDLIEVLADRIRTEAPHPHPAPELRAQSAMALLVGLSLMRRLGNAGVEAHSTQSLVDHYAPIVQKIINGASLSD
ncbi:TetR/AcrR family transcriptional regulator [Corynebacterium riegelii]|uniref:TetR/AcrR family transcriptional regulator n=1 Tax=Corynebacterium riegelii TaxID=156976 RepID=UPI00288AF304|nr:TetR/AcrR family transcriptional regulator [Corynebacterium riegelii]